MENMQNTRKSLLRRVTVATAAGLLAVVAGLGMAPAGAADELSAEGDGSVTVRNGTVTGFDAGVAIFVGSNI